MFNLFRKKQIPLITHQYKNLIIALPAHWQYESEGEDQEACFDPKSKSTLRFNIIGAIPPDGISEDENLKLLIADLPYATTVHGNLLAGPAYKESEDNGTKITLITWRLIKPEKTMAVITYAVLSAEKDSTSEKEILTLIRTSLLNAQLT
ncbi:hypothetical protein SAMN05192574_11388 [Mucilaginibacter gossypiicola]|uniref:DUF1795 domain-containing protein n=1 Tax=Mucilaginibacter gossypiicola TaxID=551995 RepID=A0A1H8SPW6_9SPHI|nr:hypothetical protein [Mucilaginibacter gossypiicola]SEO80374.1 hypothetical protein SAMN05192574_11388 [Mucilaginibacter gossypiicola]